MRRLLEIEAAKLLPTRDFRVSAAVYVLLLATALLSLKAFAFEMPNGSGVGVNLLAFPDVWHNAAYVAGWIGYLLYVMALQSATQEYQFHTARQHIAGGMSRRDYVTGKMLLLTAFAAASTLLVGVLALAFGLWSGGPHAIADGVEFMAAYALQALGYLALALLVGTMVRKTGTAVLTFIGYTLLAEPLLRALVLPARVGRYLPSAALASLVPNPFFGYAGMRVTSSLAHAAAASTVVILVLVAATAWVFSRQDL